jgi:nucleotide-binding universal stress UspA family protein
MAPVFSRLLLATEHTEFDVGAERIAFDLARRAGLRLAVVLPLQSNPEFEMVAPQLAARDEAEAAQRRQALEASAEAAQVRLELQVRRGPEPFAEVVDAARAQQADLIVIRRRGKRGLFANLMIGELVSKVVSHAPCNLLIAPRAASPWSSSVLVGIDPHDPDPATLALAAAVAADAGLPLHVLCVAGHDADRGAAETVLADMLRQARARLAAVDGEVLVGRAHEAMVDAARSRQADLIVIGRHGRQVLGRAWFGGTAQKVIGLADCAVLVQVQPNHPPTRPR